MDTRDNPMGQGARVLFFSVAVVTALSAGFPVTSVAQSTGVISGSVSVDQGEVRAFRVKAHDTAGRVAYTVYTVGGRYQIFNLLPGAYDVQVIEACSIRDALDKMATAWRWISFSSICACLTLKASPGWR